jgi:outer membrane protein assembly factor BamB
MASNRMTTMIVARRRAVVVVLLALAGSLAPAALGRSALPEVFEPEQLLWEIELGVHQYTVPQIDRGRMVLGINDRNIDHPVVKRSNGGIVMCVEQATGQMIWQLPIPRFMDGIKVPYHFNKWKCGVCSRPAIEGDRLYIVGPRGDVLCLDRDGQANGNDGPFLDEAAYMGVPQNANYQLTATDGDIIWQYNLLTEVKVFPHDVCGTSPLLVGDYLYACTGNGQDDRHKFIANPDAPSLVVLDKHTGRLVATEGNLFGKRLFHGNWSSPLAATIDGKTLVIFGGGDGILYAFEPVEQASADGQALTLRIAWQYDCNPADYRVRDGKPIPYSGWRTKSPDGPSEVIADPLLYKNRIYVAIGQSPVHGHGQGRLVCVDAATGREIWTSRKVDRSLATPAIDEGLLFIPDFTGRLHCLDAETGQHYWQHHLEADIWGASAIVLDGKVYASTERRELWVFQADREKQLLSQCRLDSVAITPQVQDDVFYLPTQRRLLAIKLNP